MGNGLSLTDPAVRAALLHLHLLSVEVHRDPDAASRRYRTVTTLSGSDRFQALMVAGLAFEVGDLLA